MSKRLKNYTSPTIIVNKHGECLKIVLNRFLGRSGGIRFKDAVEAVLRNLFLPWHNAFAFFFQNVERIKKKLQIFCTII